jgi:hypothetical protein
LTLGLVHYDPRAAAREAAAAEAALGQSLMGIEIGNEPDSYAKHGLRSDPWGYARYNAQVTAYRDAIAKAAPGIPLAGPGVSGSAAYKRWGPAEVLAQSPALLTGHHYPLGCHSTDRPTIARLLSQATRGRENRSLRHYMAVSRASGIPFRMDETNSVSCGGKQGVSNTFAAALWAANYIAQTMAAGASGINFEGNPATCAGYSPVCALSAAQLRTGALNPQPEWYALLLTRGLVGDRPIGARLLQHARANIALTALRGPSGGLRLVLVDDDPPGSPDVALSVHVGPGYRAATVLSMTAPSPSATTGVLLGGRAVPPDGAWREPARLPRLVPRHGVVTVTIAPSSAALLTVEPVREAQLKRAGARPTRSCGRTACASRPRARSAASRRVKRKSA